MSIISQLKFKHMFYVISYSKMTKIAPIIFFISPRGNKHNLNMQRLNYFILYLNENMCIFKKHNDDIRPKPKIRPKIIVGLTSKQFVERNNIDDLL